MSTYSNNIQLVRHKLTTMIDGGTSKLKVVSDFDHTLSTRDCYSSFCVLERCTLLSDNYRSKCHDFYEYYYPKANDPDSTQLEKATFMKEWLDEACKLLVEERVNREVYQKVLKLSETTIHFREGCRDLFLLSQQLQIPLVVFSAGLGDFVDSALIHHFNQYYTPINPHYPVDMIPPTSPWYQDAQSANALPPIDYQSILPRATPVEEVFFESHHITSPVEYGAIQGIPRTVYVIANHLEFATTTTTPNGDITTIVDHHKPELFKSTDFLSGFRTDCDYIHVCNKGEDFLKGAPYYHSKIKPRTNAFVCGDSLGDTTMIHADSSDNVIRIGFLNQSKSTKLETHLPTYLNSFDLVFVDNDDGIGFMNQIITFMQTIGQTCDDKTTQIDEFIDTLLSPVQQHSTAIDCKTPLIKL